MSAPTTDLDRPPINISILPEQDAGDRRRGPDGDARKAPFFTDPFALVLYGALPRPTVLPAQKPVPPWPRASEQLMIS